ncbi:glycosyltransferase family 32 protein [Corynebacterium sp. S7]
MRQLIIRSSMKLSAPSFNSTTPPVLVQFWDDSSSIPKDVQACLESWAPLEDAGFTRILFDDQSARRFITAHFGPRHVSAFEACAHPAMRADYFRLCFMRQHGGMYVDADDEYLGVSLEPLIKDGRLRLQALCYDVRSDSMSDPSLAFESDESDEQIFYVNNNPLIASSNHPVITIALERATESLNGCIDSNRDIQSLTGPGNLTASLVQYAAELDLADKEHDFEILTSWDEVAVSKWPLDYRKDGRNWRIWAQGEAVPNQEKPANS